MEIFTIRSNQSGYLFDLVNNEGDILGTSDVYYSKNLALHAMESVKKNSQNLHVEDRTEDDCEALNCPKYMMYQEHDGSYWFKLYSLMGDCVFTSVGFSTKDSCMETIHLVRRCAPMASLIIACKD